MSSQELKRVGPGRCESIVKGVAERIGVKAHVCGRRGHWVLDFGLWDYVLELYDSAGDSCQWWFSECGWFDTRTGDYLLGRPSRESGFDIGEECPLWESVESIAARVLRDVECGVAGLIDRRAWVKSNAASVGEACHV